jgi:hypothetical protein
MSLVPPRRDARVPYTTGRKGAGFAGALDPLEPDSAELHPSQLSSQRLRGDTSEQREQLAVRHYVTVAAVDRYLYAAYEDVWGCRLSYARIVEPVESPAMRRFIDRVPAGPWVYDWYLHIMFSERLLEATRALNRTQPTDSLGTAVYEFAAHWAHVKPLSDVLHHPASMALKLTSLRVGGDRITSQHEGCEPEWEFTIDELHGPVEDLYAVIKAGNPCRRG